MINLFNTPKVKISTENYSNLLHDSIVKKFEETFADYVGAKYACSFNSATNAITTILHRNVYEEITIPSMIPPVVCDAIYHSNNDISFRDDIDWVGGSYRLHKNIIDSAQRVDKHQFLHEAESNDMMIFSFYPTKPVGGCDGGIVVSNDKKLIDNLKILTMNGTTDEIDNWNRKKIYFGWKIYMNSIQAEIALNSLNQLEFKKEKLAEVREKYNTFFGLKNTSDHLYRINVMSNKDTIKEARDVGIMCGIHYSAFHKHQLFTERYPATQLPKSEKASQQTISLPFHENLSHKDIEYVCNFIEKDYRIRGNPNSN